MLIFQDEVAFRQFLEATPKTFQLKLFISEEALKAQIEGRSDANFEFNQY